jgi:hypothetical protein
MRERPPGLGEIFLGQCSLNVAFASAQAAWALRERGVEK